jgi:hypothetical protein
MIGPLINSASGLGAIPLSTFYEALENTAALLADER